MQRTYCLILLVLFSCNPNHVITVTNADDLRVEVHMATSDHAKQWRLQLDAHQSTSVSFSTNSEVSLSLDGDYGGDRVHFSGGFYDASPGVAKTTCMMVTRREIVATACN
jgi:hypothetical protein